MMAKKEGIYAGVALAVSCHNRGRADTSSYSDAVATFAKECGCNIKSAERSLGNGRNHALPEKRGGGLNDLHVHSQQCRDVNRSASCREGAGAQGLPAR